MKQNCSNESVAQIHPMQSNHMVVYHDIGELQNTKGKDFLEAIQPISNPEWYTDHHPLFKQENILTKSHGGATLMITVLDRMEVYQHSVSGHSYYLYILQHMW